MFETEEEVKIPLARVQWKYISTSHRKQNAKKEEQGRRP